MNLSPQVMKSLIRICWIVALWLLAGIAVCAQSIDLNSPSPVHTHEVVGRIAARDLGDARLTDHFYAFTGTPGDVLITIQSANLNGDVDVFTAGSLRPLLKFVLYAESASPITKSIYLRRRENLILRVEARSPNDDEGVYQLRFGGSFEPVIGGPEITDNEGASPAAPATSASGKKTRRVTSVGARIDEPASPVSEVAAAPTPEPTPLESPSPEATKGKPAAVEAPKPSPPRSARSRSRRPTGRRATTIPPSTKPTETTVAKGADITKAKEATEAETASTAPTRSSARRGASSAAKPPKPPPAPVDETGPRLIIETNEGTLVNRPMSKVRRVTVENGRVVVVGYDGKIDRIQLINIVRMTIQP
jgi:hypothetical protein